MDYNCNMSTVKSRKWVEVPIIGSRRQDTLDQCPMPINTDQYQSKSRHWSKVQCGLLSINVDHLFRIGQHWSALESITHFYRYWPGFDVSLQKSEELALFSSFAFIESWKYQNRSSALHKYLTRIVSGESYLLFGLPQYSFPAKKYVLAYRLHVTLDCFANSWKCKSSFWSPHFASELILTHKYVL